MFIKHVVTFRKCQEGEGRVRDLEYTIDIHDIFTRKSSSLKFRNEYLYTCTKSRAKLFACLSSVFYLLEFVENTVSNMQLWSYCFVMLCLPIKPQEFISVLNNYTKELEKKLKLLHTPNKLIYHLKINLT
uniref:Uncharacterized protein n=1 Tax=Heterorhabditis bacteriophora TaxID=37862 RepID=A0A1I7WNA6_HETBA